MGVVVGGRIHYFEGDAELCTALGLRDARVLSVDEFTNEQLAKFLSRFPAPSPEGALPEWIPTRPLLLGYLASHGLLSGLAERASTPDAVDGWDYLLERIYEREQRIEINLDGATLRRILERAATLARASADSLGPITRGDLFTVFHDVCGYEPDEQGVLAIQRLPGLGIYRAEDESRCFVDRELAEVCNGRELLRFLEAPYDTTNGRIWVETMNSCDTAIGDVGAQLAVRQLTKRGDIRGVVRQAMAHLNSRSDLLCARAGLASVAIAGNVEVDLPFVVREAVFFGKDVGFDSSTANLGQLTFAHCLFDNVHLDSATIPDHLPYFDRCLFEQVSGRMSLADLPTDKFVACDVVTFDSASTSGAIRSTQLSVGEKVLLVTLRKLFAQSLSGRAEGALFRGLDLDERRCVPEILKLLRRHQLALEYSRGDGTVWLPARKALSRVKRILSAPSECGEPIVIEARAIA
jgi:hypothetical protein